MSEVIKSSRSVVGIVLAIAAIASALVGLFVVDGISVEMFGIILGALGYAFAFQREDQFEQGLGIAAIILCLAAILISGVRGPPQ
jgi:hypothetical protein